MAGINWNLQVNYEGILLPTYELYGGPDYTGGVINPQVFVDLPVSDTLDSFYKAHDFAYFNIAPTNTEALAIADLTLISSIMAASDEQFDGEAHLYAGVTELALLYNVVVSYGEGDLLSLSQAKAIVADAIDNLQQAAIEPENLSEVFGVITIVSQLATFDFGDLLDDAAAALPKKYSSVLTSPKIDTALADAFDFTPISLLSSVETAVSLPPQAEHAGNGFAAYEDATTFLAELGVGPQNEHVAGFHKPGLADFDFFWA